MNVWRDPLKLDLEGDDNAFKHRPVQSYLADWAAGDSGRQSVARLLEAILHGAVVLSSRIAAGRLPGDPGRLVGSNADGDSQKSIDVGSHRLFVKLLIAAGAAQVLSEEADEPEMGHAGGTHAVAIDPLDGSGNVGLGAPLGTLFSILPYQAGTDPFLQPGREQVAAGYVSYGNSVDLGFSVGEEMVLATMDPQSGRFLILTEDLAMPRETGDLAFNASVYRHLRPGMKAYVEDCLQGKNGPRGRDFNMRWLGAAVGELHRILLKGGLFFYADDLRPGYEQGRLRHIYEANPIAFLCASAGGKASDGYQPVLEKQPQSYHGRTSLIFGSADEVDMACSYMGRPQPQ
ncbi:class 1 fructose-bisphosphatase [Phyllobacterium phragmitis]|uniref:Fructose-1,6-bisphosphatase class 1 n=1 Tax=Phyllobacterium phragmitis TaxID=2670329 RepID=A0A2S9IWD8_9HYPH|nr:class 1 fructose-bisphosphatase [Phyllobacterium phragmitis]PRD44800.1 class 1 fructose-bisphosphatase [Phyllobacterium phragmitis]